MNRFAFSLLISLFIACSVPIQGCTSLIDKPKKWLGISKPDDPRKPTKLVKIENPRVSVQSVWRNSVGDLDESFNNIRPFISSDRVVMSNAEGQIDVWDRSSGRTIWSTDLDEPITGGVNGGEGMIAIGSDDGIVIALDANNGQELWRKRLSSEVMAMSEAKFGVIVVRTNDSAVYALDVSNGSVVWNQVRETPALTLRGTSAPMVVGEVVLVGYDDGELIALNMRDGTQLWEIPVSVPKGRSELERVSDLDGEFVYLEGVIYAVNFNGRVAAIDFDTGNIAWTKDLSSSVGLSADETRVYVTDADASVWALDKSSGATVWRQNKLLFRDLTAPGVMGNYVVVGDYKGYLHWLSKEDGTLAGRDDIARGAIAIAPRVIDSKAYVLANNGSFSVLQYR